MGTMKLNMEALKILLKSKFGGNQSEMARALDIERTHLNKVFNDDGKGAGATVCGALIKYCNANNLNYKDYIHFF